MNGIIVLPSDRLEGLEADLSVLVRMTLPCLRVSLDPDRETGLHVIELIDPHGKFGLWERVIATLVPEHREDLTETGKMRIVMGTAEYAGISYYHLERAAANAGYTVLHKI